MSRGGPDIGVVQADWNDAVTSPAVPTGADDDRRTTYETKATCGGAAPEKGEGNEHDPPALNSAPCSKPSSFEYRVARRAERFGPDDMERGSGGVVITASERSDVGRRDGDEPQQASSSRVHRVADFAKWATQVAEAASADAATASSSTDWQLKRRRRKAAKPVMPTMAVPVVSTTAAADTRKDAGAAERASREAARLITSSPSAASQSSESSVQIGARAHRAASVGGGFRVTATIEDAVDDDAHNDAESQRRVWSAAAPRATRHSSVIVTAKLTHSLCVYDRRQRLRLFERDDQGDPAGERRPSAQAQASTDGRPRPASSGQQAQ